MNPESVHNDPPSPRALQRIPADEQGGDAACWLSRVCPECGAMNERPGERCWRCGEPIGEDADS